MPAAVYFIPVPWQLFGVFTLLDSENVLGGISHEGLFLVFGITGIALHIMILLFYTGGFGENRPLSISRPVLQ